MIIGQGDVDNGLMAGRRHVRQPFRGPTGHRHHRLPGPQVADGHVFPGDSHAQARAQRL